MTASPIGELRAPDLAVEVISPSHTWVDNKVQQYFGAGGRLVWIVQPSAWSVVVHTFPHESHTLHEHDTLDGGDVLPGFALRVAELFRF